MKSNEVFGTVSQACSVAEVEAVQCAALSALKPADWSKT